MEEEEDGGRGDEVGRFSAAAEALEQEEAGLLGAGFRFDFVSDPEVVGEDMPASHAFSSAPDVGLLVVQGWLRTDVSVELDSSVMESLAPPDAPPPLFFALPERSSNPIEPCFEALGVTVHPCCPLVCEWTLVIDREMPLTPSAGLHTWMKTEAGVSASPLRLTLEDLR